MTQNWSQAPRARLGSELTELEVLRWRPSRQSDHFSSSNSVSSAVCNVIQRASISAERLMKPTKVKFSERGTSGAKTDVFMSELNNSQSLFRLYSPCSQTRKCVRDNVESYYGEWRIYGCFVEGQGVSHYNMGQTR